MNKIIGIMGPNNAADNNLKDAYEVGKNNLKVRT